MSSNSESFDGGLEARKRVLGPEYVERAMARADSFNRGFQQLVTEYCWGKVWSEGSALDDRQRSLNNLCILSALNRPHEFKVHVRGALTNGCTLDEIRETLVQVAVYAGIPAGVEAFRLASEVFAEQGVDPDADS
jgi:4-carboxymuconolactone decarboxylase